MKRVPPAKKWLELPGTREFLCARLKFPFSKHLMAFALLRVHSIHSFQFIHRQFPHCLSRLYRKFKWNRDEVQIRCQPAILSWNLIQRPVALPPLSIIPFYLQLPINLNLDQKAKRIHFYLYYSFTFPISIRC